MEEREGRQNREQVAPRRHEYEGPCSHFGELGRMDVKLDLEQGYNAVHFKNNYQSVLCACACVEVRTTLGIRFFLLLPSGLVASIFAR